MTNSGKDLNYYMNLLYRIEFTPIPENEGGGYMASLPEIGRNAIIGDGDTIEEAYKDLETNKKETFQQYIEEGIEIPEPESDEGYSGKFIVRVPKKLHKTLSNQAKHENMSLNSLIIYLLSQGSERKSIVDNFTNELHTYFNIIKRELQNLSYQMPKGSIHKQATEDKIKEILNDEGHDSWESNYAKAA